MINWQRIWDDDGNTSFYSPVRIIASILSFFYLFIINFRNRLYDYKILKETTLPCPVISVGNITVGGTGKTPCVIMLAQMLQENGFKPAVISRGYGGRNINPVNIVSDGYKILLDTEIAGDEPSLMAHVLKGIPVITGAKRIVAGQAAIDQFGANVLVCDDAMQHRQIFRDVNLVLLDSQNLKENSHVLPWGRLREPLKEISRASAVLFTRANEAQPSNHKIEELIQTENIPVFRSIHEAKNIIRGDYGAEEPISVLAGEKVCAFCGIANPDSFKKALLAEGAQILSFDIFPDHHRYSKSELGKIEAGFMECRADFLITTQKDGVRLQNFPEFLKIFYMLSIGLEIIPSSEPFNKFILARLTAAKNKLTTRIPA
ncbi:MAG TPA: tetraacyldisaccharide 4'-kinase [Smithella sp.]|nr:tetraacyldisaccharide 4'-kinase [Smithella sp.]